MTLFITLERPSRSGEPLTVRLEGSIDLSNRDALLHAVAKAVATAPTVVIDAAEVDFIDCTGLGALSEARGLAERAGAVLSLGPRSIQMQRLLDLAGDLVDLSSTTQGVWPQTA